MERGVDIPASFWSLLDETRPSLQALASRLEIAPREELVEFAMAYRAAAEEICDYWSGPVVDGVGFSEDDTEDLCNWIVGQGKGMWEQALSIAPDLESLVRIYWAAEAGDNPSLSWDNAVTQEAYRGSQAPEYIAYAVCEVRFGEDLREVLEQRDGA